MRNLTRYDIIQKFIDLRGYKSFLEIGTYRGDTFSRIRCDNKECVDPDPEAHATYCMTSDEFFAKHHYRYDIIFIDGLHEHGQVWRDILNSVYSLRENGVIVMHDCLPTTEEMQEWHDCSQQGKVWTGDTWKAYLKALHYLPYYVYVVDTDFGCGIIDLSKRNHTAFKKVDMELLEWKDFDKSKMNVKDGIIP